MVDFKRIYRQHADRYDALVEREDHEGNILRTIQELVQLEDADVVELGAGTGRITRLLLPKVRSIAALDRSMAMLRVAARRLRAEPGAGWQLLQADNRRLPLQTGIADLAIAGWSLGHSLEWYPDSWRQEIDRTLAEMQRMLRPGGAVLLIETLGTGEERPRPPTEGLARYYRLLEESYGFRRAWARTDYAFASPEEAESLVRFFFGDELANRVAAGRWTQLPECTGFWVRRFETKPTG